ncbi:MAG: glycosyltransferase family 4 protein, partial [Cytophaga sp.]|uniref:glycosyltransferase family 4 protein n=1 Tax=Cytophaga sp. TaxID=29535 RepID=UPI003F7D13E0
MKSILFIWDRIGDYHLARIKACEEVLDMDVYTADLAGSDALYKWNSLNSSRHFILSAKAAEHKDLLNRFFAFRKIIKTKSIKVIALPYGRNEYHLFLLYARLHGVKTIIFSESWYSRGKVKDYLKSLLLKALGGHFFVSGERACSHFSGNYKIKSNRITQGYSVVDNNHFKTNQLGEKKYLICVARYSEEKNLEFLIRCFAQSAIHKRYRLLLVGDGPQRTFLQQLIDELHLSESVALTGWFTYNELPGLYASAAGLVLPSSFEPWGLVVNEAMAASLPIFISTVCGCLPDLLDESQNGMSFSHETAKSLIDVFDKLAILPEETLKAMGNKSLIKIETFTPNTWAAAIKSAVASMNR